MCVRGKSSTLTEVNKVANFLGTIGGIGIQTKTLEFHKETEIFFSKVDDLHLTFSRKFAIFKLK